MRVSGVPERTEKVLPHRGRAIEGERREEARGRDSARAGAGAVWPVPVGDGDGPPVRSGGRKNGLAFEVNSIRKNPSRNSNMAAAMR